MLNLELVGVTAGLENVNDSWDGRCKLKIYWMSCFYSHAGSDVFGHDTSTLI